MGTFISFDMKNFLTVFLLIVLSVSQALCQSTVETAFVVKEKDLIPEGIAYDPASEAFFLSSIHKNKIIRIAKTGLVSDFATSNKDGLLQVLGMKVDNAGRLWACNNNPDYDTAKANITAQVHVFEISTGKLVKKFALKDRKKHLFNDLHQMSNGDTYVSDSDGGAIYVIKKESDKIEPFLTPGSLIYPNGITASADESKLFVSTGSGLGIVSVDLNTKKITSIRHPHFFIFGMDGLYYHKNKLIGVQNVTFPEGIVELGLAESLENFTSVRSLVSEHPAFISPTTGVIAGDYFYFIANSQLFQVVRNQGKIKDPAGLKDVIILKIKLN
jgi:hypothetical protein